MFNEAMASSAAVLSGTESVENSLSLPQPSVGIGCSRLNSQVALPLPGVQVKSSEQQRVVLADRRAELQVMEAAQDTLHTVMLILQLN